MKDLFEDAPESARNLMAQSKRLRRQRKRRAWADVQERNSQAWTPAGSAPLNQIPAQSTSRVRPDKEAME